MAKERRQRLAAIADWIARSAGPRPGSSDSYQTDDEAGAPGQAGGYDIIALQEIWVRADFDLVAARAKEAGLRYSRFYHS